MKHDNSYGIIPLRLKKGEWQVLLVQHHAGHWAFPKGHADKGETHQQAAERELEEETGLKVKSYLSQETLLEHYMFRWQGELISKQVTYYAALVEGTVLLQEKEIQASEWLSLPQAEEKMTFKEGKKLIHQVQKLLNN
jgi:bis(5'-nucleosidyl)-tetraphosphatase